MISNKLRAEILEFRNARDWQQFHNLKDLALSISLEASELLALFQWVDPERAHKERSQDMADELADILILCSLFAEEAGIDTERAVREKLEKNGQKYPVHLAKGSALKYDRLK